MYENYDINIIRPEATAESIKFKGEGFSKERLKKIRYSLMTFYALETMATNTYRFQITKEKSELNRELIAAMLNEMTHIQDFQVLLFEYGTKPCIVLGFIFWMVGFIFGTTTRILGKKATLRLGVFVETKAVSHYKELLETVDWDEDTRKIIEKDHADEYGHINRWKSMLAELNG